MAIAKTKSCQRVAKEFVGFWICLFMFVPWERNHSVMVQLRGHVWDPSGCSRFPCFPVSCSCGLSCLRVCPPDFVQI